MIGNVVVDSIGIYPGDLQLVPGPRLFGLQQHDSLLHPSRSSIISAISDVIEDVVVFKRFGRAGRTRVCHDVGLGGIRSST